MEIMFIQMFMSECHLLIMTAETDTFFDVRLLACKGGCNNSVTEKDCVSVKPESSLTSAWYLQYKKTV